MNPLKNEKSQLDQPVNSEGETFELIEDNSIFDLRTSRGKYTLIIISILLSILIQFLPNDYNLNFIKSFINYKTRDCYNNSSIATSVITSNTYYQPKYAIYGKSLSEDHLIHVHNVLKYLNFQRVSIDDNWNLLWAHDYPFRVLSKKLHNLQDNEKVNHIPGSGYITNKIDLSITNLPFIPKSFKLPKDNELFLNYSKENSNKYFVQKHDQHRHIRIVSIDKIQNDSLNDNTFIQEFIDNPYLIDGYKFDIGVYVIITSIDPLRIYIYTGDVLFRFCPVKYYPFDSNNINKYIVGDDYLPIWNVPSLKHYYENLKFGMKDTFDAYVNEQNQNPQLIWDQVEYQIRTIILEKEKYIKSIYNRYKKKLNFFELMRFDLIIDANLKVYLIEANMSPNLSSAHFKPNMLLYEQILYNLMSLIGFGTSFPQTVLSERALEKTTMISDFKNIVTFPEICSSVPCTKFCEDEKCKICKQCLKQSNIQILHTAFREHIHKGNTKRIFPIPITNLNNFDFDKETSNLTSQNKFMSLWFYGKCKLDITWCV